MLEDREAWRLVLALVERLDRTVAARPAALAGTGRSQRPDTWSLAVPGLTTADGVPGGGPGLVVTPEGDWQSSHPVAPQAKALFDLYVPLCLAAAARARKGSVFTVAHLGQSLDGRIATTGGASQWITGEPDRTHTHRMRALSQAVVVGAGTVRHDDPQLTVRHCEGANPLRVVIDTERRLGEGHTVFQGDAAPTLLVCAEELATESHHGAARVVGLPRYRGNESDTVGEGIDPNAVLEELALAGLTRVFVEGGGITVSRFLRAACLDRLQVTVSPLIIGAGRPGISLPEVDSVSGGLRPATRRFELGEDVMFECDFGG
ncbi:MAG: RibD family protein [Alphaproteobacteria bacterium]|nr:RibD family protein [Alphaproteobacteria bacterium]